MTPARFPGDLLSSSLTQPFLVALDAIGVCETTGRKAYARGDLPFRVIRVGNALRVPSCDLEALLLTPVMDEAGAPTPAYVTTPEVAKGPATMMPRSAPSDSKSASTATIPERADSYVSRRQAAGEHAWCRRRSLGAVDRGPSRPPAPDRAWRQRRRRWIVPVRVDRDGGLRARRERERQRAPALP